MASSSTSDNRQWLKFFIAAGIPGDVAANYALTFVDNRIKTSMLPELSRSILHELGITVMGDVLAIVKHAKMVHEQTARETLLSDVDSPQVGTAVAFVCDGGGGGGQRQERRQTPVTVPAAQRPVASTSSVQPVAARRRADPHVVYLGLDEDDGLLTSSQQMERLRIKRSGAHMDTVQAVPKVSAGQKRRSEEGGMPNVKRVALPAAHKQIEPPGMYTVRLPKGTTERSRRLLEAQEETLREAAFRSIRKPTQLAMHTTSAKKSIESRLTWQSGSGSISDEDNSLDAMALVNSDDDDIEASAPPARKLGMRICIPGKAAGYTSEEDIAEALLRPAMSRASVSALTRPTVSVLNKKQLALQQLKPSTTVAQRPAQTVRTTGVTSRLGRIGRNGSGLTTSHSVAEQQSKFRSDYIAPIKERIQLPQQTLARTGKKQLVSSQQHFTITFNPHDSERPATQPIRSPYRPSITARRTAGRPPQQLSRVSTAASAKIEQRNRIHSKFTAAASEGGSVFSRLGKGRGGGARGRGARGRRGNSVFARLGSSY